MKHAISKKKKVSGLQIAEKLKERTSKFENKPTKLYKLKYGVRE